MMAFKLAFRNLLGAGLRTWLNVSVLSFAFVVIVFYNGYLDGWNKQALHDTMEWQTGGGQLWHPDYDPFDVFTIDESHAGMDAAMNEKILQGQITPVLVAQATVYPQGRMQNVLIKGMIPGQKIVKIPTAALDTSFTEIKAVVGKRMAKAANLKEGDYLQLRWRDKNGTFDARDIKITGIFSSNVSSIDNGNIYMDINVLQRMMGLENEATYFIVAKDANVTGSGIWKFKDNSFLTKDITEIIKSKKTGSVMIYGLLLIIALLAIFDTQVLSIFRRQKEIGTYIALGMTRSQVIKIFTIEGATHSILAILLGCLYGIPILGYLQSKGIPLPQSMDSYGITMGERIFPYFGLIMLLSTVLLVIISATIVSWFPARRIAKLNPTDALKGKVS
jgi:ABC-type lipoprotein release transport system permease subunit